MGCFHFGAIINNMAIGIYVQVFYIDICPIFFGIYLPAEFLDHVVTVHLTFLETAKLLYKVSALFHNPTMCIILKHTIYIATLP